jgi:hypothetical protein
MGGASKKHIKDPNISISLHSLSSFFYGSLLTHQSGHINHAPGVNTWWWFAMHGCIFQGELQVCSTHTNLQLPSAIITQDIYIYKYQHVVHIFQNLKKSELQFWSFFYTFFFSLFKDQESEDPGSRKDPRKWSSRLLSGNYGRIVFLTKFWWLSLLSVCWPPKWMV